MPTQSEVTLAMACLNVAEAHWRDTSSLKRNFPVEETAIGQLISAQKKVEAFLTETLSEDTRTFFLQALGNISDAIQSARFGPEQTSALNRQIFDAREFLSTAQKKLPV